MNDDLNIRFSSGGNKSGSPKEEKASDDLDLVVSKKGLVKAEEERKRASRQEVNRILEEVSNRRASVPEPEKVAPEPEEAAPEPEEAAPEAEEAAPEPEEAAPEAEEVAPEAEEVTPEQEEAATEPEEILPDQPLTLTEEDSPEETDTLLKGLAFDSVKGKYDFLNLGIIAVFVIFIGMTFIFMKPTAFPADNSVKATKETLKTGEFTAYLSEKYTDTMPMPKIMTQANVIAKNLFGKSELEFVDYKKNGPPDGPVDLDIADNMALEEDPADTSAATTTAPPESTLPESSTGKIPQEFEVSHVEDPAETDGKVFTGRPIKTTTSKETTTLDLPKATKDTSTRKVQIIDPA